MPQRLSWQARGVTNNSLFRLPPGNLVVRIGRYHYFFLIWEIAVPQMKKWNAKSLGPLHLAEDNTNKPRYSRCYSNDKHTLMEANSCKQRILRDLKMFDSGMADSSRLLVSHPDCLTGVTGCQEPSKGDNGKAVRVHRNPQADDQRGSKTSSRRKMIWTSSFDQSEHHGESSGPVNTDEDILPICSQAAKSLLSFSMSRFPCILLALLLKMEPVLLLSFVHFLCIPHDCNVGP